MANRKAPIDGLEPSSSVETVYLSIGGLSRATGVPIETLRTWELRYGFPKSVRKPSGHRRFEVAQVERIRRISLALERGLRAGEVVPASDAMLGSLLATIPVKPRTRSQALPFDDHAFIELIKRFDADRLMRSLHSDLANEDPLAYIETRILPCLELIGAAWAGGEKKVSVQAQFLKPVPITQANLDLVLKAGWIKKEVLCKGVTDAKVTACK